MVRSTLVAAAPLGAAVAVFGVVFGAAAGPLFGPALAIAASLLIYSGAVQFAVLALVAAGAGGLPVLLTVLALNSRNLVLGAVLRPRIEAGARGRAALAWFLVDESFGLALAAGRRAALVLLLSGAVLYVSWQAGTVLGVAGATVVAVEGVAAAIFPVLFIGLAAITVRGRSDLFRAATAALCVAVLTLVVPGAHAFLPILAALAVAFVGGDETPAGRNQTSAGHIDK
ncbi:MAG: AzlC family ABC transporter permease [Chloroflexota bacterium]|nr:AzlC family ABC transporter permease [Chloroflexota bacterium]